MTEVCPHFSTMSCIGWMCQKGLLYVQAGRHGVSLSHGQAPRYLADHLTPASDVASRLRLRSANRQQLLVPRCRAFAIAGSTVWNSLPDELKDLARGSDSFKQFLKTILFSFY